LRSLERATAELADLRPRDKAGIQQAFEERDRAIEAIAGWVAAEHKASRPVSPELANHLTRDLELGAGIMVRLAIGREATRLDLAKLGQKLQMLRSLSNSSQIKRNTINCQG